MTPEMVACAARKVCWPLETVRDSPDLGASRSVSGLMRAASYSESCARRFDFASTHIGLTSGPRSPSVNRLMSVNAPGSDLARALIEIDRALSSDQVLTDPDICASYGRDESETPARTPDAVVRVRSSADVVAVMKACSRHARIRDPARRRYRTHGRRRARCRAAS